MSIEIIECGGAEALSQLEKLRAESPRTGTYPFLMGDETAVSTLQEFASLDERAPSRIIAAAQTIDPISWFNEQEAASDFDEEELLGEWDDDLVEEAGDITAHLDILSGDVKPVIYIGLATIRDSWMLPAEVGFGGWNACPEAAVHCAVLKYWQELYGAEIISLTYDVIECRVSRPPTSPEAALQLAWEQFWYCPDLVDQGMQTVANLAASLLNVGYWYFWWD